MVEQIHAWIHGRGQIRSVHSRSTLCNTVLKRRAVREYAQATQNDRSHQLNGY